jgi:hypothetical protein
MFSITRILGLAVAAALVSFAATGTPARAEEPTQNSVGQIDENAREMGECHLHRRAISRHACQAKLSRGLPIDTAETP